MEFEQEFDHNRESTPTEMKDSENHDGYFDCNICLDIASDPVVTLCGHLYCWPCIFKWFHVHTSAPHYRDEYPRCPVCKADISHTTLIPLYGRGQPESKPNPDPKAPSCGTHIPPRPAARGTQDLLGDAASQPNQQLGSSRNNSPYQHQYVNPFGGSQEAVSTPLFNQNAATVVNAFQPVVGMFGEMVYARVFGNAHSLYTYPNSYHVVGGYGSRLRRQEMQVDKSLSRISLFLLCCFLLCVLLF